MFSGKCRDVVCFFLLAIVLLHNNNGADPSIRIIRSSLLALKASSSSSTQMTKIPGFTKEHLYRLKIVELKDAKLVLDSAVSAYNECIETSLKLNNKYQSKSTVCSGMKNDYKRYCSRGTSKDQALTRAECEQLLENLRTCYKVKHDIKKRLDTQERLCLELKRDVEEAKQDYQSADNTCSMLEASIYRNRVQDEIRIYTEDSDLECDINTLSTNAVDSLVELIKILQLDLEKCLSELSDISERLANKNLEYEDMLGAHPGHDKTTKKKIFSRGYKYSTGAPAITKDIDAHKKQMLGLKKMLLTQEIICRNLESSLEKAKERLDHARRTPPSEDEPVGCFTQVQRTLRDAYRRLTTRRRERNHRRRHSTRF